MRPPVTELGILIDQGHADIAKQKLQAAMRAAGGTIEGAAPLLGMSVRQCFRYSARLGVPTMYAGRVGTKKAHVKIKKTVDIGE